MLRKLLTIFFSFLILLFTANAVQAQEAEAKTDTIKKWTYGGFATLNLNQAAFVNWAAGGQNSFAVSFLGNVHWEYKNNKHNWENNLDIAFGIQKIGKDGFRKNEDKIDFLSKYGYDIKNKKIFATLLANFKSQFARGYEYPDAAPKKLVSRSLAPGYLLLSAGIDFKPLSYFSVFLSPATGKITFIRDQNIANAGTYGNKAAVYDATTGVLLTEGETIRSEFGAYLNMKFQKEIFKNVTLMTKVDLFNNYTDKNKANRKNIDVNWETVIDMKINKFLTASITTQLIYDNDIMIDTDGDGTPNGPRVQFKEVIGIGLSYKF